MRIRITDTTGRHLGGLELERNNGSTSRALPSGGSGETARPRRKPRGTLVFAAGAVAALALVSVGAEGDEGTVTPLDTSLQAPVAPAGIAGGTDVGTRPASLERTAPYSGSTYTDAVGGWEFVELSSNGDVTMNGVKVDNVHSPESPLRARYLESLDSQGHGAGTDPTQVSEGIKYCKALERGDVFALRELADATGVGEFGTSPRREAVALAATTHLCPAVR